MTLEDILTRPLENRLGIGPGSTEQLTVAEIIKEVALKYGLTYAQLVSHRRHARLIPARHEAYFRAYKETSASLPQIGLAFGGRDHTTIMHGIRRHESGLS
jgi:chromosomal replication initiator protein